MVSDVDLRTSLSAAKALAAVGPFNETTVESAAYAAFSSATAGIAALTFLLLVTIMMPAIGEATMPAREVHLSSLWSDAGLMLSGALLLQVYCWSALDTEGPVFVGSLVFAGVATLRGCLAIMGRQTLWGLVAQGTLVSPVLVAILMPSLRLSW
jgi:hypothetical protein